MVGVNNWSSVHNWSGVDDWDTVVYIRTLMRERYCHSMNTLTLSRLEQSGEQPG